MHPAHRQLQKSLSAFCFAVLILAQVAPGVVHAAGSLTDLSDTLSDNHILHTNTTHVLHLTTATTSPLLSIQIVFSTTNNHMSRPAGLDLTGTTLTSVDSQLGTGWSLDTTNASGGILLLTGNTSTVNALTSGDITLGNITNSKLNDCTANTDLNDTCFVQISTYSDNATSVLVDDGVTTYTVIEDPALTFEVKSIASGQTHDAITTTRGSTATTLAFGKIQQNNVEYISQELHIETNSPRGFTIYAYLGGSFNGGYGTSTISPFGATNATWGTPQSWVTPTGTTPNSNSGWFGINTSDTSQSGWSSPNGVFAPLSTAPHVVASSSGPARNGISFYLTYGLEANTIQPSDTYSDNIIYRVEATY